MASERGQGAAGGALGLRERILDAAGRCLAQSGYQRVSMEAIAAEAGIGRSTLYRYFPNRDEVLKGVVVRESRRHHSRIVPRAKSEPDIGTAILTFVRLIRDAASQDPTIGAIFNRDNQIFTRRVLVESSIELFEIHARSLEQIFEGREHELRAGVTLDDAAEWVLRVTLSLLTVRGPRRRSSSGLDDYLSRYLLPVLVADPEE